MVLVFFVSSLRFNQSRARQIRSRSSAFRDYASVSLFVHVVFSLASYLQIEQSLGDTSHKGSNIPGRQKKGIAARIMYVQHLICTVVMVSL